MKQYLQASKEPVKYIVWGVSIFLLLIVSSVTVGNYTFNNIINKPTTDVPNTDNFENGDNGGVNATVVNDGNGVNATVVNGDNAVNAVAEKSFGQILNLATFIIGIVGITGSVLLLTFLIINAITTVGNFKKIVSGLIPTSK